MSSRRPSPLNSRPVEGSGDRRAREPRPERRSDRNPAENPRPRVEKSRLTPWNSMGLIALLVLPLLALRKLAEEIDLTYILPVIALWQLCTYLSIWIDKSRAINGKWRIPEATLHGWEMFGGWPAGFLAQRQYRHKVSKRSYQTYFWLIVITHQYIALDYVLNWWVARGVISNIRSLI